MSRRKGDFAPDDGRTELYLQGLNDTEIAKKMFLNPSTVWQWRNRRDLLSNQPRGRKSGGKKQDGLTGDNFSG
jgi:Putative ATPase subunit of terminase (gpP-like).